MPAAAPMTPLSPNHIGSVLAEKLDGIGQTVNPLTLLLSRLDMFKQHVKAHDIEFTLSGRDIAIQYNSKCQKANTNTTHREIVYKASKAKI